MPDLILPAAWNSQAVDFSKPFTSTAGNWSIHPASGTVSHQGTPDLGFGAITFPTRMINGEFSAHVSVDRERFGDPATAPCCHGALVFRFLGPDRYYAFGIGGWGFHYSLFYRSPGMNSYVPWEVGGSLGDEKQRNEIFEFDLAVRMVGSTAECFLNGSRVFAKQLPESAHYQNGQVGFYAYSNSSVSFSDIRVRLAPLTCFVVSPINVQFDEEIYSPLRDGIEALKIADHEVRCVRADQNHRSEPFIRSIIEQMKVANVTVILLPGAKDKPKHRNENVFYELGMAHAMSLPTVIYAKRHTRMPADLRHLNIITSKRKLIESVREILSMDQYHQIYVA